MGVKIVNCSWGSNKDNPALEDAISNSDMLFVCAAGNGQSDLDVNPVYPASYDLDNVISVASMSQTGML
jgi:subtilisin family serine protease